MEHPGGKAVVVATDLAASFGAWLDCYLGLASVDAFRAVELGLATGTIAKARALAWHEGRMDSAHKVSHPPSLTLPPITAPNYDHQRHPQLHHFPSCCCCCCCFLASSTLAQADDDPPYSEAVLSNPKTGTLAHFPGHRSNSTTSLRVSITAITTTITTSC